MEEQIESLWDQTYKYLTENIKDRPIITITGIDKKAFVKEVKAIINSENEKAYHKGYYEGLQVNPKKGLLP